MPRLQILVHKSYHPYLEKNKQKVREDEAKAKEEEEREERRMILADSEARLELLRSKASGSTSSSAGRLPDQLELPSSAYESSSSSSNHKRKGKGREDDLAMAIRKREETMEQQDVPDKFLTKSGHINFWKEEEILREKDRKRQMGTKEVSEVVEFKEDPNAMYLGTKPSDLHKKPWYADSKGENSHDQSGWRAERKKRNDLASKSSSDPLTHVQRLLAGSSHASKSTPQRSSSRPTSSSTNVTDPLLAARLNREEAERNKAQALMNKHRAAISTPSSARSHNTYGATPLTDAGDEMRFNPDDLRRVKSENRYWDFERDRDRDRDMSYGRGRERDLRWNNDGSSRRRRSSSNGR